MKISTPGLWSRALGTKYSRFTPLKDRLARHPNLPRRLSPCPRHNGCPLPSGSAIQNMTGNTLTAPLPGTVIEVFVKPGDKVETGQVVLIIEAMKMKNSIRSVRTGMVGQVLVSTGQSVAHKQALISFADSGEASWI